MSIYGSTLGIGFVRIKITSLVELGLRVNKKGERLNILGVGISFYSLFTRANTIIGILIAISNASFMSYLKDRNREQLNIFLVFL
jgi:hypothetical protein